MLQRRASNVSDKPKTKPKRSTSFGRFDASKPQSPQANAEVHQGSPGTKGEPPEGQQHKGGIGKKMKAMSMTMRKKMGRKYVKALSEEMGEDVGRDHGEEGEAHLSDAVASSHPKTSNSMESIHSEQRCSGGVTSGSVPSGSGQRLEEDHGFTGQFCGRAKVHTNFLPSPYDTGSLKLKAGDIIDIISKTPMGIWTGMLNGKVGNFKFIYVDVLSEEPVLVHRSHDHRRSKRPRPKTLHELLEKLNLEELECSLLLNGYQTVEDLKYLKEQHLIELNVTDPQHRLTLLAFTQSLQDSEHNNQKEDDEARGCPSEVAEVAQSDCPRDSGCYAASDSSDNSREDTESHVAACAHSSPPDT
ncbi:SAM domain-containing protein SAMSN-1b isoform X2 [Brachyhypopomus gauderio]|uniref:SAM domain-containing protein SAMSN-1b isoform X2 n=1 Tax=Brachyhypopomus gauderio TaxID=698409 RepID=UPI0040437663